MKSGDNLLLFKISLHVRDKSSLFTVQKWINVNGYICLLTACIEEF